MAPSNEAYARFDPRKPVFSSALLSKRAPPRSHSRNWKAGSAWPEKSCAPSVHFTKTAFCARRPRKQDRERSPWTNAVSTKLAPEKSQETSAQSAKLVFVRSASRRSTDESIVTAKLPWRRSAPFRATDLKSHSAKLA